MEAERPKKKRLKPGDRVDAELKGFVVAFTLDDEKCSVAAWLFQSTNQQALPSTIVVGNQFRLRLKGDVSDPKQPTLYAYPVFDSYDSTLNPGERFVNGTVDMVSPRFHLCEKEFYDGPLLLRCQLKSGWEGWKIGDVVQVTVLEPTPNNAGFFVRPEPACRPTLSTTTTIDSGKVTTQDSISPGKEASIQCIEPGSAKILKESVVSASNLAAAVSQQAPNNPIPSLSDLQATRDSSDKVLNSSISRSEKSPRQGHVGNISLADYQLLRQRLANDRCLICGSDHRIAECQSSRIKERELVINFVLQLRADTFRPSYASVAEKLRDRALQKKCIQCNKSTSLGVCCPIVPHTVENHYILAYTRGLLCVSDDEYRSSVKRWVFRDFHSRDKTTHGKGSAKVNTCAYDLFLFDWRFMQGLVQNDGKGRRNDSNSSSAGTKRDSDGDSVTDSERSYPRNHHRAKRQRSHGRSRSHEKETSNRRRERSKEPRRSTDPLSRSKERRADRSGRRSRSRERVSTSKPTDEFGRRPRTAGESTPNELRRQPSESNMLTVQPDLNGKSNGKGPKENFALGIQRQSSTSSLASLSAVRIDQANQIQTPSENPGSASVKVSPEDRLVTMFGMIGPSQPALFRLKDQVTLSLKYIQPVSVKEQITRFLHGAFQLAVHGDSILAISLRENRVYEADALLMASTGLTWNETLMTPACTTRGSPTFVCGDHLLVSHRGATQIILPNGVKLVCRVMNEVKGEQPKFAVIQDEEELAKEDTPQRSLVSALKKVNCYNLVGAKQFLFDWTHSPLFGRCPVTGRIRLISRPSSWGVAAPRVGDEILGVRCAGASEDWCFDEEAFLPLGQPTAHSVKVDALCYRPFALYEHLLELVRTNEPAANELFGVSGFFVRLGMPREVEKETIDVEALYGALCPVHREHQNVVELIESTIQKDLDPSRYSLLTD